MRKIMLGSAIGLASVCAIYITLPWSSKMISDAMYQLAYEDFTISGTVIDESGNALSEVVVRVNAGRRRKMGTTTDYDNRFKTINGRFHFKFDDYSSVSLIFLKRRYEKVDLQFTEGGTYSDLKVVMKTSAEGT